MTSAPEIHAEFRSTLGKFTLEAVFSVPATGITMLFGPSGCGKTTVLRCIAGLIHIKDGLCDIAGEVWQDRNGAFVPTHKRAMGYVFQEASLFPHMSVRKNLLFGAPREKPDGPTIDFYEVVDLLGHEPGFGVGYAKFLATLASAHDPRAVILPVRVGGRTCAGGDATLSFSSPRVRAMWLQSGSPHVAR